MYEKCQYWYVLWTRLYVCVTIQCLLTRGSGGVMHRVSPLKTADSIPKWKCFHLRDIWIFGLNDCFCFPFFTPLTIFQCVQGHEHKALEAKVHMSKLLVKQHPYNVSVEMLQELFAEINDYLGGMLHNQKRGYTTKHVSR